LALAIALMSAPADAKGCLKGAAAGCVIGHHEAKKNERNEKNNANQPQ
jgi:hypothetical protein